MSINELDARVKELRSLRTIEAKVRAEISAIEDILKAEMLTKIYDHISLETLRKAFSL